MKPQFSYVAREACVRTNEYSRNLWILFINLRTPRVYLPTYEYKHALGTTNLLDVSLLCVYILQKMLSEKSFVIAAL